MPLAHKEREEEKPSAVVSEEESVASTLGLDVHPPEP